MLKINEIPEEIKVHLSNSYSEINWDNYGCRPSQTDVTKLIDTATSRFKIRGTFAEDNSFADIICVEMTYVAIINNK